MSTRETVSRKTVHDTVKWHIKNSMLQKRNNTYCKTEVGKKTKGKNVDPNSEVKGREVSVNTCPS